MTRARRRLVSLALVLLLTAPAAWGRPSREGSPAHPPSPASRLLAFVSNWLGSGLSEGWLKNGSLLDPFGRCAANTSCGDGSIVEPNGSDATSVTGDAGSLLDPNG